MAKQKDKDKIYGSSPSGKLRAKKDQEVNDFVRKKSLEALEEMKAKKAQVAQAGLVVPDISDISNMFSNRDTKPPKRGLDLTGFEAVANADRTRGGINDTTPKQPSPKPQPVSDPNTPSVVGPIDEVAIAGVTPADQVVAPEASDLPLAPNYNDQGPEYELAPNYNTSKQALPKPSQEATTSARLSVGHIAGSDLEDYMASNQGKWELIGKGGAQALSEAVLGTVEAGSYLLDWEQGINHLRGAEQEYSNWLAKAMKEVKGNVEEATHVYQSAEAQQGFAPGDGTWWAKHTPSTIGTALSLMIPAAGAAGVAGKFGKMVGMAEGGINLMRGVSATVASRYAEATMEANGVYERAYNDLKNQGIEDGLARQRAGQAASKVWNTNWVFAAQDFLQYSSLLKGFGSAAKGKAGFSIAELLKNTASEGAEEAGQFIVGEEAYGSAVQGSSYFGRDFGKRLYDYVQDPEFKSSVLLGAVGGAVFSGLGPLAGKAADLGEKAGQFIQERGMEIFNSGFQKERANYRGDKATSMSIDDVTFARQVSSHLDAGTLPTLMKDYDALEKEPELPTETRNTIRQKKEDIDFLMTEQARLKTDVTVPAEVLNQILFTKLDQRNQSRLHETLTKDKENLLQEAVTNKELPPDLRPLKELQLTAFAYNTLAKNNPQFADKAMEATLAYENQKKMVALAYPNADQTMTLSQDNQLREQATQLAAVNEKMVRNKEDLVSLTTPAGQDAAKQKERARKAAQEAAAFVANPDVTVSELRQYIKDKNPQGMAQNIIMEKLQEVASLTKNQNQADAFSVMTGTYKPGEPKTPDMDQYEPESRDWTPPMNDVQLPEYTPPTGQEAPPLPIEEYEVPEEEYTPPGDPEPPTLETPADTIITPDQLSSLPKDRATAEDVSPVVEQKSENTVQQADTKAVEDAYANETVAGFLKMLRGRWTNGVFEPELDANGVPIPQEWYGPQGPVSVLEIFRTDSSGQHLLIDTPQLQVGRDVVLEVVDDGKDQTFPYTLTPGFRPDKQDNWVINVYLADEKGESEGLPIMQLPSGDNKARTQEAAKIRALRSKVIKAPGRKFLTKVGDTNSIGEFIITKVVKDLNVLKFDYHETVNNQWAYGATGHNPIIAQAASNGKVDAPNVDTMNGMTDATIKRIESFIDRKGGTNLSPGATYILRTNRLGNFQAALGVTRKVNEAEIRWINENLPRLLVEDNLSQIREVINLRKWGAGIYKDDYKQVLAMKNNSNFSKLHFIQTQGQVNGEILIPYKTTEGKYWLAVRANGKGNQLPNLVARQPFFFEIIDGKGVRHYKHTASMTPENVKSVYDAWDKTVAGYFKNISDKLINSEISYTDPVTNKTHKSYYDYLVETNTLATDLPGSKVLGKGQESSFSFHNSKVGIAITPEAVQIRSANELVTPAEITTTPVEPPAPQTPPAPKNEDINDLWAEWEGQARPFKPADGYTYIGDKELTWFNNTFGEEALEVSKNVDRIYTRGGQEAFGIYHNALVRLADFAEEGTLYHEAFHFAVDLQSTPKEKARLLEGTDEETRAEEFREYMLSKGVIKPKEAKAVTFFQKLARMIRNLFSLRGPIEKLFEKFANLQLDEATRKRYAEARKDPRLAATEERPRLLPKFPNYIAMNQAISAASYEVVQIAKAIGTEKKKTMFDVLTNDEQRNNILQAVRNKFNNDFTRILAIPTTERTREDKLRFDTYLAMGVPTEVSDDLKDKLGFWDAQPAGLDSTPGFKQEVVKSFQQLGFGVRETDETDRTDEEESVEEEYTEDSREHIFDLDHTLVSPVKSLGFNIKMFMAGIPEPILVNEEIKLDAEGQPEIKRTIFGTPVMIDFNRVYNNLKIKLVGSPNPIAKLGELAQSDPISKVVYDALTAEVSRGNVSLFQEFNTNMNLANYHQVTPLYGRNEEGISEARIIATNQSSAVRVIKDKTWKGEAIRKSFIDMQGVVNHDKSESLLKRLMVVKEMVKPSYEDLVTQFRSLLTDIGVTVPVQVWNRLGTERPERRMATIRKWFFGEKDRSLENFLRIGLSGVDPFEQTTVLNDLARLTKNYTDNRSGDTHLNEKMKQVNPINTPCYLTEFVDDINQDYERAKAKQEFFKQDLFYNSNRFVGLFTNKGLASNIELDFVSASRELNRDAKDFGERGPADSFLVRFISYFNNAEDSLAGKFFVTTFSDKTKQAVLSLPKYKGTNSLNFLKDVLYNTTVNEVSRMQRNKRINTQVRAGVPLPSDITPYNVRGERFLYVEEANKIPDLTSSMNAGEASVQDIEKAHDALRSVIADHIDAQYEAFEQNLVENGLIGRRSDGGVTNIQIPTSIVKSDTSLRTFLKEFFYNDYAWRTEVSKVLAGDKALYKSDDDYNKRMYELVTPGLKPYSDPTSPTVLTRIVYPKVKKRNAPGWINALKALIPEGRNKNVVDNYEVSNATDAQSFATVGAYRSIRQAMGTWTDAHELVYQKAWSLSDEAHPGGYTVNQAIQRYNYSAEEAADLRKALNKITLQPLKPFQYNDRVLSYGEDTIIIKEQFKDSIAPITPELANRHKEYGKLLAFMQGNKADIASAEDTLKVGNYGTIQWGQEVPAWQKRRVSLKDIRIPQVIPDAEKEEIAGSQFWKLIDADIEYDQDYIVDGKPIKGRDLIVALQKYRTQKLQEASKELQDKLGLDENFSLSLKPKERAEQLKNIKIVLDNELLSRDLNENYQDAIRLVLKEMSRPDFTVHLGFPTHARKFESVLLNLFKKNVLKKKSPGTSMVNIADFNISGTQGDSNLSFLTSNDGKLQEAEIGMPISFFNDIGLDYIQHMDPVSGKLRWESLSPEQRAALQMIVYRIPTSNKSSMLPVRVAMVVPASSGNVIMVPAEITTQQGLDFDVDKSNILRRVLKDGKVDKSSVDNKLFDLCWGILMSTEHLSEMLTPLAAPTLVSLKEGYQEKGIVATASKFPVTTTAADVATEDRNKDSKAMIGIISRFNTAHSLLQKMAKAHLVSVTDRATIKISTKGYDYNEVGRKFDSRGNLISNNYGQLQHQSLDNPKDPILSDLNIYTVTMPLAGYFTEMGVPLEVLTDFMMQPIIREWVQQYKVEGGKSPQRAFDSVLARNPQLVDMMTQLEDQRMTITEASLKDGLTKTVETNLMHNAQVLSDFKTYLSVAKQAARISNVLSIDTFSGMTDIESIESFSEYVNQVTDERKAISLSPAIFTVADAPPEVKSVGAYYQYGILDAVRFTGQFFPYMNQSYAIAKDELAYQVGQLEGITDIPTLKKFNSFLDFYLLDTKGLLKEALNKVSPRFGERWMYVPGADQGKAIWNYIDRVVEQNKFLKQNALIQALENHPNRDKRKVQAIGVSNTNKSDNKSRMVQGWRDMLYHPNPEVRTLGGDLIRFAIYSSGFGYTTSSFVDLIPSQFWVESGLGDTHENLVKGLIPVGDEETPTRIDAGASTAFIRNKFEELDIVPETYEKGLVSVRRTPPPSPTDKSTHILEFSLPENHRLAAGEGITKWIKIKDRNAGRMRLYESSPNDPFLFREVQPLGEGRAYTEVTTSGRDKSRIPFNQEEDSNPDPFGISTKALDIWGITKSPWLTLFPTKEMSHYLPDEKNSSEGVIKKVLERETDPITKEVLKRMLANSAKVKDIPIIKLSDTVPEIRHADRWPTRLGELNLYKDDNGDIKARIIINDGMPFSEAGLRHTLTHELIHGFTIGVLDNPITESEKEFNNLAIDLAIHVRESLPNAYAGNDQHELVAELASNPHFRAKVMGDNTLWRRIVRMFRRLFGFPDTQKQGFEEMLGRLYTMMGSTNRTDTLKGSEFRAGSGPGLQADPSSSIKLAKLTSKKENLEGEKRIHILDQILSSLDAQKNRLRNRGFKDKAKMVGIEIDKLEAVREKSFGAFVNRYLTKVASEIKTMHEATDQLEAVQDASGISPKVLYGMREQLISYDLLATLKDEMRRHPEVYGSTLAGKDLEMFDKLMSQARTLESRLRDLRLKRVAWKIKNTIDTPMTIDQIRDQLEVADRDISWANWELDPGVDVPDTALQAMHKLLRNAYAEGDRITFDFLNSSEQKTIDGKFHLPEEFLTPNGEIATKMVPHTFKYKTGSAIQALEAYEAWLGSQGINSNSIVDKFKPVIEPHSLRKESSGVEFLSPKSKRGKEILAMKEDHPLRRFYEIYVLSYLKSQESLPSHLRPGLRIPSIGRGLFEAWMRESGKDKIATFKEQALNDLRRRYDEVDYKAVDEAGNPQNYLPVRFIARQDGTDGRLSTREVSLDIANTVTAFINEINTRTELDKVIADSELIKGLLEERELVDETQRLDGNGIAPWLMRERKAATSPRGKLQTKKGINSYSFRMAERMLRRLAYGQYKKDEGTFKMFGQNIEVRKFTDAFLKYTGLRIMLGNIAIPLTNLAMGETALWKEAVGGNLITTGQVAAGNKFYTSVVLDSLRDLNNRQKQTKFGRFFAFFNPMDHARPNTVSGIDSTWMRKTWENLTTSSPVEFKLSATVMGAVFQRFPAKNEKGENVSFYDAVEVTQEGKIALKDGFTYKDKKSINSSDVDEIRDYTLRLYEYMNGIYNTLDSPGIKESSIGTLLLFMRNWLRPGFRTRWELKRYDPRFKKQVEGHYISAMVAFNNMFNPETGWMAGSAKALRMLTWMGVEDPKLLLLPNEMSLPQEEQDALIDMRKANIRKSLFELYLIAGLSLLIFGAFGDDDDDSYAKMMLARMRREAMTFLSPGTAWDVLRSPTVALRTVEDAGKLLWAVVDAPIDYIMDGEVEVYERGKYQGIAKWKAEASKSIPIWSQLKQFEDIPTQTRLITQGIK